MPRKPTTQDGYSRNYLERVRSACLYVATKLGDLIDHVVIVGGLAPSLQIDQSKLPPGIDAHVGTQDLDLGLTLAILEEERYEELSARLRNAGLALDINEHGNVTNQRWRIVDRQAVTIDFLIPPSGINDYGGRLRNFQQGFAAVITPGLHLAFDDRICVPVSGRTPFGEQATRNVWVCGPGAYLVLKALAFRSRGANKDAYDLHYVLSGIGIKEIVRRLLPLQDDLEVHNALTIIREDFTAHDGIGPMRVAEFLTNGPDDDIQADVVGTTVAFLTDMRLATRQRPDVTDR